MSVKLNLTDTDHIPEDFTLESLSSSLTEGEIAALNDGEDPILTPEVDPAEAEAAALADQQQADAAARAAQQQQAPAPQQMPDTTAAEAIIAKTTADIDALEDRFDAGELSLPEKKEAMRALIAQQAQAQAQLERASEIAQQNVQSARAQFYSALDQFKAKAPFLWSDEHLGGWDAALKTVTGSPAYVQLSMEQKINLAHDMYAANYKAMSGGKAIPAIAGGKAQDGSAPKEKRTDERDPVQTLGDFNTDSNASIEDGTFAVIDRKMGEDPIAAEKMFNRLTPDQQQAYLNA
jgi:hypothetical protein